MIHCVLHDPDDSVAVVVVEGVEAGTTLTGLILDEDRTITLPCVQDIPLGHKVALKDMAVGDTVIKYGVDIGKVVQPIGRASMRTSTTSRRSGGDELAASCTNDHANIPGATAARTAASACAITSSSCRSTTCRTRRARRSPTTSRERWRFRIRTAGCSSAPISTCISAR